MVLRIVIFVFAIFLSATVSVRAQYTEVYEYDVHGRLVKVLESVDETRYVYDDVNNRLRKIAGEPCSGGAVIDGVCYRAGAIGETCTQACSYYGGCDLAGTQAIGSSAPSQQRCVDTRFALLGEEDKIVNHDGSTWPDSATGCVGGRSSGDEVVVWFGTTVATACGTVPNTNMRRFCACNDDN